MVFMARLIVLLVKRFLILNEIIDFVLEIIFKYNFEFFIYINMFDRCVVLLILIYINGICSFKLIMLEIEKGCLKVISCEK